MSSGGRWLGYSVDFDMDMAQLVCNGVPQPQTDIFSSCGSLVSKLVSFRGMVMVSLHSVMSRPVQLWANSLIWIILDIGVASETSTTLHAQEQVSKHMILLLLCRECENHP